IGLCGCKVFWKPQKSEKEIMPASVLFHRKNAETNSELEPGLLGEYFDLSNEAAGFLTLSAIKFDEPLLQIASNTSNSIELRVEALAAAASQLTKIQMSLVEFLLTCIEKENPPLVQMTAASALNQLPLDQSQLLALTEILPRAGTLEISKLLGPFSRSREAKVGNHLLSALEKSPALESIRADTLRQILKNYSPKIQQRAEPLLKKLSVDVEKQKAHLDELKPALTGGDAPRGRELFFTKATCFACHTVQGRGGRVGPDLSKIGAIRAPQDLLEAIVFPSASFARGFEPFLIVTKDDEVHPGIISRETADAIYFYDSSRIETRILRAEIKEVRPGTVSVMPEGLEAQLSRQELGDIVAFLLSLR
ncbi:MAG: c-type cytochrome, partial [Verrucomicrobiota bacterium]|nr:c-type cytochrome [Verrucomicrobiota bacterium]